MIHQRFTDAQIREALKKSGGKVSTAARKLHCCTQALYYRMDKNPKLKRILDDQREKLLDLAESKLVEAVKKGEGWAICFALKCQGKGRGYIERQAVEYSGTINTQPVKVKVVLDENWYGNADRLSAAMSPASTGDSPGPREAQACRLRETVGKNGDGTHGNGDGARPGAGGNGRSH